MRWYARAILLGRDVVRRFRDLLIEALCAAPDLVKLLIVQGRHTGRRPFHESLVRFNGISKSFQNPTGKARHGGVSASLRDNAVRPAFIAQPGDQCVDGCRAIVPHGCIGFRSIDEAGGVQRVVIEKGKHLLNLFLQRGVLIRVCDRLDLKVHMELRARSAGVFHLHVVAAERDGVGDIRQHLIQLFRCDPFVRILAVIIVAVHHDDIRAEEVVGIPVSAPIFSAHMIGMNSRLKLFSAGDLHAVGIETVLLIADDVSCLHDQFHFQDSFLSV